MCFATPGTRGGLLPLVMAILATLPGCSGAEKARADKGNDEVLFFTSMKPDSKRFAIVSLSTDGSKRATLSKGEDLELDPALSPDGKQVVFVVAKKDEGKSDLCVMNVDGTGRRTILKGTANRFAMSPAWSPDGKRIAYTVPSDGVIVMGADGKNASVLGGGIIGDWSPDGKKILYTVIKPGREATLHVMDADGKNVRKLLEGTAALGAYSPDGKRLVYMGSRDGLRSKPRLFVADADGKNSKPLPSEEKAADVYPRWSADGRHIYFTRMAEQGGKPGRAAIHVMDADGANVKALSQGKVRTGTASCRFYRQRIVQGLSCQTDRASCGRWRRRLRFAVFGRRAAGLGPLPASASRCVGPLGKPQESARNRLSPCAGAGRRHQGHAMRRTGRAGRKRNQWAWQASAPADIPGGHEVAGKRPSKLNDAVSVRRKEMDMLGGTSLILWLTAPRHTIKPPVTPLPAPPQAP
jgi:TolB protein